VCSTFSFLLPCIGFLPCLQDFYNLVDVYLDAVLHPRCISDKRTFEQEGWHLELDDPADPLTYKGVVFNEMKGVYSSPDSHFYRVVQQVSIPGNDAGLALGCLLLACVRLCVAWVVCSMRSAGVKVGLGTGDCSACVALDRGELG
jgi:hypothetical protein